MEMREGFMRPPRNRGGLMWPLVPLRGRNMMGMERMRLPPLRPGLIRGGPPVPPPFVGRGMTPPHARPRGIGPVMLPRPPIHPSGPMVPLGPRGMLPRAMLPPRPPGLDTGSNANENVQIPINGIIKEPLKNVKEVVPKNVPGLVGPNQMANRMVANRNIKVHNRMKGNQNTGQSQLQNMHPVPHHPQTSPVQQNTAMNAPHIPKHIHPIQSQMNTGGAPQQTQSHPMQHQPSLRGGRNNMNPRNRGASGMGRGALMSIPQMSGGVVAGNRGNAILNRGAPPNISPRAGQPVPPGRANIMGGLTPSAAPYSSAPPPPPSSYAVPPPVIAPQGPVKRSGPPMGIPPPMPPKRVRYDTPLPSNGYGQYQQQPTSQIPYSSYDVPPPTDMYSNTPPIPPPLNASQSQGYNSPDYNYPSGPQNTSYSSSSSYSSYHNDPSYSSYSGGTSSAYDSSLDYHSSSNIQSMNTATTDPYGYKATAPTDSYVGYSNSNYSNSQANYDDYSSGYMDNSAYGAPVQDSSYGQSVGTYNNYSY